MWKRGEGGLCGCDVMSYDCADRTRPHRLVSKMHF